MLHSKAAASRGQQGAADGSRRQQWAAVGSMGLPEYCRGSSYLNVPVLSEGSLGACEIGLGADPLGHRVGVAHQLTCGSSLAHMGRQLTCGSSLAHMGKQLTRGDQADPRGYPLGCRCVPTRDRRSARLAAVGRPRRRGGACGCHTPPW